MSEFWLWFWRPIAEVLGTVTLIAAVIGLLGIGTVIVATFQIFIEKWKTKK